MSKKQSLSREEKRARFSGAAKKPAPSPFPKIMAIAVLVVVVVGGALLAVTRLGNGPASAAAPRTTTASQAAPAKGAESAAPVRAATSGHAPYPAAVPQDGLVQFSLSTFDDGKAHHYTYMNGDQPIEFFVLKSSDGVVRAAFNACDVCFPAKLGYRQDGDVMVCNNCGRRFPSTQINVVRGGCNPSPLERSVQGDNLIIRVEDILAGATYF